MWYISPETALSPGFANLWKENTFCSQVVAVVMDEAHCVDEMACFEPNLAALRPGASPANPTQDHNTAHTSIPWQ